MASTLVAMVMIGLVKVGVGDGVMVGLPLRGIIHRPVHVHFFPHTMLRP